MIALEDIPDGIINEIKSLYSDVSFEHYGEPLNDNCVSRKSSYIRDCGIAGPAYLLDPITMKPVWHEKSSLKESFFVRGEFNESSANVYQVWSSGIINCLAKE